jgi:plastocyanin
MSTLPDHDGIVTTSSPARSRRVLGQILPILGFVCAIAALVGCANKTQESSSTTTESTTPGATESMVGATSTINLTWDQQDSCVTFVPKNSTIHVGDRVNFNTSMAEVITVHVPAGLFSVADTNISVSRGANSSSPRAEATGAYPLSSSPTACSSVTAGSGPSINVDAGDTSGKP